MLFLMIYCVLGKFVILDLYHLPDSLFTFFANIHIAEIEKSMLMDTGSSRIWTKPKELMCSINPIANKTGDKINYVDGTIIQGSMNNQTVIISSYQGTIPVLRANTIHCPSGYIMSGSGIVGISPKSSFLSILDSFSPIMSYHIHSNLMNATIVFGGMDTEKFHGELEWLSATPLEWRISARISIGEDIQTLATLIDSGTSLLVVSPLYFQNLTNSYAIEKYEDTTMYHIKCNNINTLPIITITFQAVSVTYEPREYTFYRTVRGERVCFVGIQPAGINDGEMIVGNLFLVKLYVSFDYKNNRIGFGLPTYNIETTSLVPGDVNASPNSSTPRVYHFWKIIMFVLL
jgi:hypothetical protein